MSVDCLPVGHVTGTPADRFGLPGVPRCGCRSHSGTLSARPAKFSDEDQAVDGEEYPPPELPIEFAVTGQLNQGERPGDKCNGSEQPSDDAPAVNGHGIQHRRSGPGSTPRLRRCRNSPGGTGPDQHVGGPGARACHNDVTGVVEYRRHVRRGRNPEPIARRLTAVRFVSVVVVLVALAAPACGSQNSASSEAPDGAIPRVFRHDPSPVVEGEGALIAGTLQYDGQYGCFLVEIEGMAYPLVWPAETSGVSDGPGVELADGLVVRVGDHISGGGGFHSADRQPVAGFGIPAECLPATSEVAVFNVNERVTRP